MNFSEKLILALDFPTAEKALFWVNQCIPYVKTFKVGKQLFIREGPQIIREIQKCGGKVFLDLKFHDIPNTVAEAVRAACELGVFMCDLHVMGGIEMMKAARKAIDEKASGEKGKPLIIAVTVLTSLSKEELQSLGIYEHPAVVAVKYAKLAKGAGLDGVVCSAREVVQIKRECGKNFLTITPGIRFEDQFHEKNDDQKRIATPAQAFEAGSDFLVLGRVLFKSRSPIDLLKSTLEKLSYA